MTTSTCHVSKTLLLALRSGMCGEEAGTDTTAHLAECAACRERWAGLSPLSREELHERIWGRVETYLREARAERSASAVSTQLVRTRGRRTMQPTAVQLLVVSVMDLAARIGQLLSTRRLASGQIAVRGVPDHGEPAELPLDQYLWLYRGRSDGAGPQFEFELGLWLRKRPSGGHRLREFCCSLYDEAGSPVPARSVRLRVSGGSLEGAGDLGSAIAMTDSQGVATFPVWIGGDWLVGLAANGEPARTPELAQGDVLLVEVLAAQT
jgi:hypothetical protein